MHINSEIERAGHVHKEKKVHYQHLLTKIRQLAGGESFRLSSVLTGPCRETGRALG